MTMLGLKSNILFGLVALASVSADFCGCHADNIRKEEFCFPLENESQEFPTAGGAFYDINLDFEYNITDVNVLISLTHPAADEIEGKLTFAPDVGSDISVDLFDITATGTTIFDEVQFDDDAPTGLPNSAGTIGPGFFTPIDDLTVFENLSTKGSWKLFITDDNDTSHDPGTISKFCIVVTTPTAKDVEETTRYRRKLEEEALKRRTEAAIKTQNQSQDL
eukprot:CAMPEP_0197717162 /NCGR_PEP_ID=MMETSP1434-20131217/1799_1 /TAXON_ID=265543 /ORGANISM="Minutocellus polymorphus, Strain CCMP3303" /LENGTH=219 /DNA_ID=CAMNT_0043301651 /DNA_START=96 /DNA_END=755 /DNA_ORIENTATION=+